MTEYHFLLLLSVIAAAISQLLLKQGALLSSLNNISAYSNYYSLGGYLLLLSVTVMNLFIFKYLDIVTIVFFLPITYIVIALGSSLFFGEKITKSKLAATGLIFTGIALYYH